MSSSRSDAARENEACDRLLDAARVANVRGYKALMDLYRRETGIEFLELQDKKIVSAVAAKLREIDATAAREEMLDVGIAMFTAYSTDYSIGYACESVNRMYAEARGYEFHTDVLSYQDMMAAIAPRQFCGWYKVAIIRRFLADMAALRQRGIGYIMWIDADAVVINQDIDVHDLIRRAGYRDLIIAEDVNPCCLINTGVVLIRVSEWSAALWEDVWAARKYFDVFYYEQSALMRCLKTRLEGLDAVKPFHSYVNNGPSGDKLFPHTCVVPHLDLNSNRCRGLTVHISNANRTVDTRHSQKEEHEMAAFIFHCAGRCDKAKTLRAVLAAHNFDVESLDWTRLNLQRRS
ncbi:hypothetical protein AeRB84_005304 [Aphanomyces euteiches]|nr:hypothetical protein AeRB84_005304 [Aphanomyces euteiches]